MSNDVLRVSRKLAICHMQSNTSVTTQYALARCTPDAAAQLQPIPYACGAQRALLPIAVGAMSINELMKTFIRHIGRKHTKIQYKNRLKYDETIQYNILQYSTVKEKNNTNTFTS